LLKIDKLCAICLSVGLLSQQLTSVVSATAAKQAKHGAVASDPIIVAARSITQIRLHISDNDLRLKILQHDDFVIRSKATARNKNAVLAALDFNSTPGSRDAGWLPAAALANHHSSEAQ
jgi:hypothetical protein